MDAIYQRRSVKNFDPAFAIPDEDEVKIFEAARQTPSSFNMQHWRFVNVKDAQLRQQMKEAAFNQPQISDASMLLLICADVNAHEKQPERYWQNAPDNVRSRMVETIRGFYTGKDQAARDEAMRSVGLVAQTVMLAAKSLGYDSAPIVGFDYDVVARLINLPNDHVIGIMIAIGKPLKEPYAKGGYLPLEEIVKVDRF